MNCATLVAALPTSLEAMFKPFVKESNRSIHSTHREDFLISLDGMKRYPFFVDGQSESQRLMAKSGNEGKSDC